MLSCLFPACMQRSHSSKLRSLKSSRFPKRSHPHCAFFKSNPSSLLRLFLHSLSKSYLPTRKNAITRSTHSQLDSGPMANTSTRHFISGNQLLAISQATTSIETWTYAHFLYLTTGTKFSLSTRPKSCCDVMIRKDERPESR